MALASKQKSQWVRWFDVTNPVRHSGGYTVYKVTSKVFPVHSSEATSEIVVWKRYRDFQRLHKTLCHLHRSLHRPGTFPDFPKPIVFKRFEETVIEERRAAAITLLNFVGEQPYLFNSLAVQDFFSTSETVECVSEHAVTPDQSDSAQSRPLDILKPIVLKRAPSQESDGIPESMSGSLERTDVAVTLSGVWEHRYSDSDQSDAEEEAAETPTYICENLGQSFPVSESFEEIGRVPMNEELPAHVSQPSAALREVMNEFDPCKQTLDVKQAEIFATNLELLSNELVNDTDKNSLLEQPSGPSQQSSSEKAVLDQSVIVSSLNDLMEFIKTKDDYLYKSCKQIKRALRAERLSQYQVAFDYYKSAIASLLTGVQGDADEVRRCVVRRKTSEYLTYAEGLHLARIDGSGEDSDRWKEQQVPRYVASLKCNLSELSNYKVLGLLGNNLLVLDKTDQQTYVIKVLQKNSDADLAQASDSVIPTNCLYMVKLHKYFETECKVYLLLEHAPGTLWQYIHNFVNREPGLNPENFLCHGDENIYTGKKCNIQDQAEPMKGTYSGIHYGGSSVIRSNFEELRNPVFQDKPEILGEGKGDNANSRNALSELDLSVPAEIASYRIPLRRSNSSMNRSASVERASDIITSPKPRTTSFFDFENLSSKSHIRVRLPETQVRQWAAELLMAIENLHHHKLILKNLNPDNILLDKHGRVLLTYFCVWFGVSYDLSPSTMEELYVAPEGFLPGGWCRASDYWSFGAILYELLTGVSLSVTHPEGITSHTLLITPDFLSDESRHILQQLLKQNPKERLGGTAGIQEIKAHPFFAGVKWSDLERRR